MFQRVAHGDRYTGHHDSAVPAIGAAELFQRVAHGDRYSGGPPAAAAGSFQRDDRYTGHDVSPTAESLLPVRRDMKLKCFDHSSNSAAAAAAELRDTSPGRRHHRSPSPRAGFAGGRSQDSSRSDESRVEALFNSILQSAGLTRNYQVSESALTQVAVVLVVVQQQVVVVVVVIVALFQCSMCVSIVINIVCHCHALCFILCASILLIYCLNDLYCFKLQYLDKNCD